MKVALLAGKGDSTWIVANALGEKVPLSMIVLEESVAPAKFIRNRARRYGWISTAGQILFMIYLKLLRARSRARLEQLAADNNFKMGAPAGVEVIEVQSANDQRTIELLRQLAADVIVVNGTRILSARLLNSVNAVFINMHAGITPQYRGVHGGYWALACNDAANAGVTVHLVDAGIDTGDVLYQARIFPAADDNFATYPMLQLAAGMPLLIRAINELCAGQTRRCAAPNSSSSGLFAHPTLWGYFWLRITTGIR
jgi:phosphoribosylglycinamide formyltransferase 1